MYRNGAHPVIVVVGLDKVGKTTLARSTAFKGEMGYDNFPSSNFPLLRTIGKASLVEYEERETRKRLEFIPTAWSRALSHALAHSLTYDIFRYRQKHSDFKGMVYDRFWYCNYAYGKEFLSPEQLSLLMEIEENANNPIIPDIIFQIKSNVIFGLLEEIDLESMEYREKISRNYDTFLPVVSNKYGIPVVSYYNVDTVPKEVSIENFNNILNNELAKL